MTPNETSTLIDRAGGPAAFGRLLGIDETDGWLQRVNNWKHRGLPAAVELEHQETIRKLREERSKATRRKAS